VLKWLRTWGSGILSTLITSSDNEIKTNHPGATSLPEAFDGSTLLLQQRRFESIWLA
jgi:hypothetical protein